MIRLWDGREKQFMQFILEGRSWKVPGLHIGYWVTELELIIPVKKCPPPRHRIQACFEEF